MQTQIDSHKRAFLKELEALLKKYDVNIAGFGSEQSGSCVDINFKDGSSLSYSPQNYDDVWCVVDASRVFDFD